MAPVWLTGQAMYWGTPSTQFVPWWWQAWKTLLTGELPLWNPLVGMGAPLLANYQSALLYPPTWTYFGLAAISGLPLMAWGQAILVAIHLAWSGWGMGSLLRRLGKSELAQTIGGLAFGLSGYLVARAHFLSVNSTVTWLPWIMLVAYEMVQDPKNTKTMLKLALVLALQWLAGHAQISWYTLILAVAWIAFWAWRAGGLRSLANNALRFGLAGLLAFFLSAAQLLPTAEYLANSQRSTEVGFEQAATYSFWPWRLIGLLAPNFFGNPAHGDYWGYGNFWEDAIYIGLLPLLLALAILIWSRKKVAREPVVPFVVSISILSILLALGSNTPLFEWLYRNVPTFALFQSPARFTIWFVFGLALLAGLAVDYWKPPKGRALYWSRLAVAAAIAIILGAITGWLLARAGVVHAPDSYFTASISMGIVALAAAWLHLRKSESQPAKPGWSWLAAGLVAADLLYAGWGLNPGTSLELYKVDDSQQAELREQVGDGRLFISEADEYTLRYDQFFQFDDFFTKDPELIGASLLPNTNLLDGIRSANNYDPLVPEIYRDWMDILANADAKVQNGMLQRMSISVMESLNLVGEELVFFNDFESLPRARWVNCALAVPTREDALERMKSSPPDPTLIVIIVEPRIRSGELLCGTGEQGVVEITQETSSKLGFRISTPGGGWMVLSDTWDSYWYVDSKEDRDVYLADGIFQAIRLRPHEKSVEIYYSNHAFFTGAEISFLTAAVIGGLLIVFTIFNFWKRNTVQ